MKIGDIFKVRTNSKGWVDAELLEERATTVRVRLMHDNSIITRKKNRDLKEEHGGDNKTTNSGNQGTKTEIGEQGGNTDNRGSEEA